MSKTPIQKYYEGKTIFVTGGSGFMGKVLLEKLLYSCSDVKEIYVLIRTKRGKIPRTRIDDWFKLPVFGRIREEKPSVFDKLTAIPGDTTIDGLGMSNEDARKVMQNTQIVFHCAATLKLESNLKDAVHLNTTATKRILDLATKMPKLEAMLHLSTAFCYCDKEVLDEQVYNGPHSPYDIMRMADWMDVEALNKITPDLLGKHPNTYTYTKRLTEMMVRDYYPRIPVSIVRPSIVCPAFKEPIEGWVDSLNGPVGIMVGAGKGVIRSMLCCGDYKGEVIAVDLAINGIITIAYTVGSMMDKPKEIPVYNVTCTENKKTPWTKVVNMGKDIIQKYPFEAGIWFPDGNMTTNKIWHTICVALFHWLPAYFIDFLMVILRQKPFLCRIQTYVSNGLELLQFFTMRDWIFKSEKYRAIRSGLTEEDQKIFDTDTDQIDEYEYMKIIILGGRQFCLKEPLSSMPKARMQLKILYIMDRTVKLIFWYFCVYALLTIFGLNRNVNSVVEPYLGFKLF